MLLSLLYYNVVSEAASAAPDQKAAAAPSTSGGDTKTKTTKKKKTKQESGNTKATGEEDEANDADRWKTVTQDFLGGSQSENPDRDFFTSVLANIALTGVVVAVFILLLWIYPEVLTPRLEDVPGSVDGTFDRLKRCMSISTEEVRASSVGLDGVVFLHAIRALQLFFVGIGFILCGLLLPVTWRYGENHLNDGREMSYFFRLSIANLEDASHFLWVYVLAAWIITGTWCYTIWTIHIKFLEERRQHLLDLSCPTACTIIVRGVTEESLNKDCFRQDIQRYYGRLGQVHFCMLARNPSKVEGGEMIYHYIKEYLILTKHLQKERETLEAIKSRENSREALQNRERSVGTSQQPPTRAVHPEMEPEARVSLSSIRSQDMQFNIEETRAKINILEKKISLIQDRVVAEDVSFASSGFITFDSMHTAELAASVPVSFDRGKWRAELAPGPGSVRWDHLLWTDREISAKGAVSWFFLSILFTFFMSFVVLCAKVVNKETLGEIFPLFHADYEQKRGMLGQILVDTTNAWLASIVLKFSIVWLPWVLYLIGEFRGHASEVSTFRWVQVLMFNFLFFFIIIVSAFSTSTLGVLFKTVASPLDMVSSLTKRIPELTINYVNFILVSIPQQFFSMCNSFQIIKYHFFGCLFRSGCAKSPYSPVDAFDYSPSTAFSFVAFYCSIGLVFSCCFPIMMFFCWILLLAMEVFYKYMFTRMLKVSTVTPKPKLKNSQTKTQMLQNSVVSVIGHATM